MWCAFVHLLRKTIQPLSCSSSPLVVSAAESSGFRAEFSTVIPGGVAGGVLAHDARAGPSISCASAEVSLTQPGCCTSYVHEPPQWYPRPERTAMCRGAKRYSAERRPTPFRGPNHGRVA